MSLVSRDVSLKDFNTLRLEAKASHFAAVSTYEQLLEIIHDPAWEALPRMVLGGGSNLLLTKDIDGLVLRYTASDITVVAEHEDSVIVRAEAGCNWHDLVTWAVNNTLGGIENLALIPGTVGAAPVQNIGAYGQQISDVLHQVSVANLLTGELSVLSLEACEFGYRDSIFKHTDNAYLVLAVELALSKKPTIEDRYYSVGRRNDSLVRRLKENGVSEPTIRDLYEAVIAIRSEKLLDPAHHPTVGSYFKNPLVSRSLAQELSKSLKDLQYYPADNLTYLELHDPAFDASELVKLPAGRLIDARGWAGRRVGHVWMSERWASIVTHDGEATGEEVLAYLDAVASDVLATYGVPLEPEVVVI